MNVILQEDIENLGFQYEVVEVKNGYGRNFLIPTRKAILATKSSLAELDKTLESRREEEEKQIASANTEIAKLEGLSLSIPVKSGDGDKLYGSLNNADLVKILNDKGINVERKHVSILGKTIKRLGNYTAIVKPHRDVEKELEFEVVSE